MNNPYDDKAEAKGEELKAKMAELEAKLKGATADARIAIQEQIDKLRVQLT